MSGYYPVHLSNFFPFHLLSCFFWQLVSATRTPLREQVLQFWSWRLVGWVHIFRTHASYPIPTWRKWYGPIKNNISSTRNSDGGGMACMSSSVSNFFIWFTNCLPNLQGHTKLPDYITVGQFPKPPLRDLFTAATADTLNLLNRCLTYEPRKRIIAREVSPNRSYSDTS
jgi:hypothetical protein